MIYIKECKQRLRTMK